MKINKLLIVLVILSSSVILSSELPKLNNYGHIELLNDSQAVIEYFLQEGEYYLKIEGYLLKGNSVEIINNGYLTLTTLEENVPAIIRIYDLQGDLRYEKSYRRIVNLKLSNNRNYAAFYTEDKVVFLDLLEYSQQERKGVIFFHIDNQGNPIIYDESDSSLKYRDRVFQLEEYPREMLLIDNVIYLFTDSQVWQLQDDEMKFLKNLDNKFFEARKIDELVYYVTKSETLENWRFWLFQLQSSEITPVLDQGMISRDLTREHEPIPAPLNYGEDDFPFMIGNSYGALQEYGQSLYMHPGVDFNGADYQEVYAVRDGFVKRVLTTGGSAYWRVAIANEDTAEESEGYLYAHLNQSSITVTVGDTVYAGDLLGTLYDWPVDNFTHIHFARIRQTGENWNSAWWTIDNPQIDFTNIRDTIPPNLENTLNDELLAFRNEAGDYLEAFNLSGEFDIISKCHDYCNSPWAQGPYEMWFTVASVNFPDEVLYEHPHLVWDMPLDVYHSGQYSSLCVNTFYSRDAVLYSTVGYDYQEAYHIITNADDDPEITELDALQMFDSAQLVDGYYLIDVHALDQSMNESVRSMLVAFNNGVDAEEENIPDLKQVRLQNYPNPFNPTTGIYFEIPEDGMVKLDVFNSRCQLLNNLANGYFKAGDHFLEWDGTADNNLLQSSGIYLYKLHYKNKQYTKKMMMIK